MSTLKATFLQQAASTNPNITLDGSANATVGGTLAMGSSFKRNKLINGSMNVYQRGSVAATTSGAYTLDRWFVTPTGATVTVTQSTATVPTNFTASLNVAGAASVTNVSAYQRIESINCQELTSGSKVTVSGYIYQSTGSAVTTATVALVTPTASDNYASTTSAATTYTIPSFASATWTYFSNTFTLTTGCTNGLQLTIALGTGLTTGSFNLTGVQLEVGSVATPYERQIYSEQLAQCQRYYYRNTQSAGGFAIATSGFNISTTQFYGYNTFPVTMRTNPTSIETTGTAADYRIYSGGTATACSAVPSFDGSSVYHCQYIAVASGLTNGYGGNLLSKSGSGSSVYLAWSAEL
jgi:uncharacterized Zn-binding protein involved in type VI secretion